MMIYFFYLIYEFYKFEEFKKLEKKALPEKEAKKLIRQLVEAVSYLHQKGISAERLDLKPEKIISTSDTVKILDIGLHQASYPTEDKLRSIQAAKSFFVAPEIITDTAENEEKKRS